MSEINPKINQIDFIIKERLLNDKMKYTIYLDEDISLPDQYRELDFILRTATENDEINIIFNTDGGYVDTMVQLYNRLKSCLAKTKAEIFSACSAGAIICCACKEWITYPFSKMMFHDMTTTENLELDQLKVKQRIDIDIRKCILKPLLSVKQYSQLESGKEVWLTEPEIKKLALNIHRKHIKK